MGLTGARLVGLLLVWMAVGFALQGLTAEYEHELAQEIGQTTSPPTLALVVTRFVLAGGFGLVGLLLLVRQPGEGAAPGVAIGREVVLDDGPRRCWRCRRKWPAGGDECPHCGAGRLR